MGHEIRKHMAAVDGAPLSAESKTVQIDETFIGRYKKGGYGGKGKTIFIAMVEDGGDVVTEVIKSRALMDIMPTVMKNVLPDTEIHTDQLPAYNGIKRVDMNCTHKTVEHELKSMLDVMGRRQTLQKASSCTLNEQSKAPTSGFHLSIFTSSQAKQSSHIICAIAL